MSCEFAHLDGSYVLGAVSPRERREVERHLSVCTVMTAGARRPQPGWSRPAGRYVASVAGTDVV